MNTIVYARGVVGEGLCPVIKNIDANYNIYIYIYITYILYFIIIMKEFFEFHSSRPIFENSYKNTAPVESRVSVTKIQSNQYIGISTCSVAIFLVRQNCL